MIVKTALMFGLAMFSIGVLGSIMDSLTKSEQIRLGVGVVSLVLSFMFAVLLDDGER